MTCGKYPCFLLCLLLLCRGAGSQAQIVSIDKTDTAAYTRKIKTDLAVSIGVEIDKEKTTLVDATNTLEASLQKNKELFIVSASERFTYQGPQTFLNTGYLHLRYRHCYRQPVHAEFFTQYQWDEKIGLIRRSLLGANLRYHFNRQQKLNLTMALGMMYEAEEWDFVAADSTRLPVPLTDPKTYYLKLNTYLKMDLVLSSTSTLSVTVFYQARPDVNFIYPRIAQLMHLVIAINTRLSWDVGYYGIYDVRPVVPIPRFYYSLNNALVLKL